MAARSIDASPNVRAESGPTPSELEAAIADELIEPIALPAKDVSAPHDEPPHVRSDSVALLPPLSRWYSMRRSPAVRTGVTPLVESVCDWLNSKSMFVVPFGSWTRVQNRCRNDFPAALFSLNTPNCLRSLLFGGIDRVTGVGTASSSDVPARTSRRCFRSVCRPAPSRPPSARSYPP